MKYEEFKKYMAASLKEKFGECYRVNIEQICKNNGVIKDAISVKKLDETVVPVFYLDDFYDAYRNGISMEEILKEIKEGLCKVNSIAPMAEKLQNLEGNKDNVMFKVINRKSNMELLKTTPHIPVLDLAIVFYLYLGHDEHGLMSSLVNEHIMGVWGVDVQYLWKAAQVNTQRAFPMEMCSLDSMMKKIVKEEMGNDYDEALVDVMFPDENMILLQILTNATQTNGSAVLFYPDLLSAVATSLDDDLVILPSSRHEVLVMKAGDVDDYEDLHKMVTDINQTELPRQDYLSDNVYCYSRATDELVVVTGTYAGNSYRMGKDADKSEQEGERMYEEPVA